jgi:TolA-binding protein
MKVVDIHPEELIDKLAEGSLTSAERARLDAHHGQCSSCRFEIAVRADLARDGAPFEERPQLMFAGDTPRERMAEPPRELPVLPEQVSRSLRARSRRRWPLVMLAAALVLCAGGAMGAVITRAVRGQWLPWSPQLPPAESNARVVDAKPPLKPKRAVAPASAPAVEASTNTAAPAESVASVSPATPEAIAGRTPLVVASRSARARAPARRVEDVPAPSQSPRAGSVSAFPALPAAGLAEGSQARGDAAGLFAEANRARRDGNADRAVGLYRALQSRYPNSSESELSRALLAQLLLERGNPEAALADFDRYLAEDTPVLNAEALVGRARALEQLGKSTQAAAAWRQVQSRFPGSVHARLAATRLAALGMR